MFDILKCATPEAWIKKAIAEQDLLLLDHAHCEKKAATTALTLIGRYPQHTDLVEKLSRLAREELRHFEQVLSFLKKRNIDFVNITASRYASGLFKHARTHEPVKLIDTLIIGAFVEARSCERFGAIAPHLRADLSKFYFGLLAAEARHYEQYISFARKFSDRDISDRIEFFGAIEHELIATEDASELRFHSGVPI
jgi:tRNA-(ms[2]io[6]A)-hydroxylase